MNNPSPSIRSWVRRLVAEEAANQSASDAHLHVTVRVYERLRISLTRFVGADGFTALLRRAVALARRDVPSLEAVKVTGEGRLGGIEELAADANKDFEAATAIAVHLLALLVTFLGESLTLRLLRETLPSGRIIAESEDFQ